MDYTFHPELVAPFYLEFMNANLLRRSPTVRAEIVGRFKEVLPLYSDTDIRYMLRSSWRPAKVAAWVIAARRDSSFLPDLERHLHPPAHVEHVFIALGALVSPKCPEIIHDYLSRVLEPAGGRDESLNPDWALAALEFIDPKLVEPWVSPEGPWEQFICTPVPALEPRWRDRLRGARGLLPQAIELLQRELAGGQPPNNGIERTG